jgi:YVTN family beta-propeller protein
VIRSSSLRFAFALLIAILLASAFLCAQASANSLLALAKKDTTLAIIDPGTLKVIARIPAGPDPHEIVASEDGKTAYISNYGGGAYNTLTIVDLVAQKGLETVDLGALRGPHGLAIVAGKVWFTAEAAKAIGRYDPAGKKVDWVMGTGQNRTHMIYVFPDLQRIVTTNVSSATVSFIDRTSSSPQPDWNEKVIPVGGGSEGFDVTPDGKQIWVANAQDGTISVIDVDGKKVIDTLAANVGSANRLKFTLDGRLALVSGLRLPELTIFDVASRKEMKRVKIGHGGAGILMQPDGTKAYVACSPDGYVVVIDLKSLDVIGRIDVGQGVDGLAWAARQ